jgi:very-short-patch-repair endonuclease
MPRHILTNEERRRGGKTRATQESFVDLQRERGRRGAAALLAKPSGLSLLLDKLAAYNRRHPTPGEAFTQAALESLGLVDGRDFTRQHRLSWGGREFILDFRVGETLVLEPGHRRWHGGPAETLDGTDRAAHDAAGDALLAQLGMEVVRIDADECARTPKTVRTLIAAKVAQHRQR